MKFQLKADASVSVQEEPQVHALVEELTHYPPETQDDQTEAPGTMAEPLAYCKKQPADGVMGYGTNPVDENADLSELLSEQERRQLLVNWNATDLEYPRTATLIQLFEAQVARTPEATAVIADAKRLTYRELNERANKLARHLRNLDVRPEVLVGLCLERSERMLIGILGILKAGGAYVPLDPAYPKDRLAFMLDDANAPVVVTEKRLLPLFRSAGQAPARRVVRLDADWNDIERCSAENPRAVTTSENLAYVIYTSGSTGKPKGVAIEHRAPVALMHWAKEVYSHDELCGVLAATSICFDLSIFEMFVPLSWGGKVILVENAMGLAALPATDAVTLVNTVPSAMRELLRVKAVPASVRVVNLAGEPLATSLVDQIYAETSVEKVYDLYGPTETTTYSTGGLRQAGEPATIGRPLANEQAYVLDASLQPVPIGVPGELYIGGDGLARGYLHRPELTAEKFIPHPFKLGERLYKTGDLARWRADGNLEFLGRLDHQVKIRGFRIELGEVESALRQHPQVTEAVIIAHAPQPGDKRLAAYAVVRTGQRLEAGDLRQFLKERLPEYMVPLDFIFLDAFPLTPNGKLDRKALPAVESNRATVSGELVSPRTPLESTLAQIWCEVLGLNQVGVHDNFFELGGHSLLAIQVVSRVREALKAELPLFALFDAPTIAALAEGLTSGKLTRDQIPALPLPAIPRDHPLPVSFAQERLWFLHELDPGSHAYNVPIAVRLTGNLNTSALERAIREIAARHEAFRTVFAFEDGNLRQVITTATSLPVESIDLRTQPEAGRERSAQELVSRAAQQPFDLARGPLVRATLAKLGENEHVFVLVMHHSVSDGWSLSIFFQELEILYNAFSAGLPASLLPELPVQVADVAHFQREQMQGAVLEKELAYWKDTLGGAPPSVMLPVDLTDASAPAQEAANRTVQFTAALSQSLTLLCQRRGCTPFMVFLTALAITLRQWTHQRDLVLGTVVAGRNRRELENVIGCFMTFLPLRINIAGSETGEALLAGTRATVLNAQAHQDCPLQKIVEAVNPERRTDQNPLYNVALLFQNFPAQIFKSDKLQASLFPMEMKAALLDLRFEVEQTETGLSLMCEYKPSLFTENTIDHLLVSFQQIFETLVRQPGTNLSEFKITPELAAQAKFARPKIKTDTVAVAATFTAEFLAEPFAHWMKELELPATMEFAPYGQVYQQLLDPESLLASNQRGLNVVLVRLEDWERTHAQNGNGSPPTADAEIERSVREFTLAITNAASRSATPYLVCLCPSSRALTTQPERAGFFPRMEQFLADELGKANGIYLVTTGDLFDLYPVPDHYDPQGEALGHVPYTPAYFAALATMIARRFHALKRTLPKVIALDCDQTLWRGVCGEDGPEGVQLDPPRRALQEFMHAQLEAGRLLCVCSKNNEEDVVATFDRHREMPLGTNHFAATRINWSPKSENLRTLAQELNLGLDSFIFVDDSPMECAEVSANCPEVVTLQLPEDPEQIPQFLKHCWVFDRLKTTVEDRQRTELYQQNRLREEVRKQSPNLADFLATLDLKIQIGELSDDQLPRVAQLTQRTNQFNTATHRHTESDLQQLCRREGGEVLTVNVADRFGDYGLAGAVICRVVAETLVVDDFLLSCRVLGRGVEHHILTQLGGIARQHGVGSVDVHFVTSAKNKPAFDFLESVGAPFRQALNGGYVYRFPTEFAATVAFKPQSQESVEPPLRAVMPSVVATNGGRRFSRYQWIAREADDTNKIVQMIEAKAGVRPGASLAYTGPRSDLERQLCEIWEKLLRIEQVGIHDNFFEMGGHSLLAVRMFAQVETLIGKKLPVVTIFQSPTIDQLAKVIGEKDPLTAHPNLVPIQSQGLKSPLFLVHGAGGDVLWGYANLAHHTDPGQPIYGIQTCGDEEFATLEDMAEHYVAKVRAFQSSGPYHLGGYCFGGNVAQEMARQLEAQGETVALLALLDCAPANRGYERIQWRPRLVVDFTRNLLVWFDNFFQLKPAERRNLVLRKLRTLPRKGWERLLGRHSPEGFDLEEFIDTTHVSERETRLWNNHLRLLVRHTSGQYSGPVTLFRTRGQPLLCSFENDFGWGKLATNVTVRKIHGSHEGIFIEPHVRFLAGQLEQALHISHEQSRNQHLATTSR